MSAEPKASAPSRPRLRAEVLIVLGLSVGQSAVYSAARLIERFTRETPIGNQAATLNPSQSAVPVMDVVFQLLRIGFGLVPVALALFLLSAHGQSAVQRLGLTGPARAYGRDLALGAGLAAAIGIPGLGLYVVSRLTGTGVQLNTSGLPDAWWAATILLLSAAFAGILEEVLVVGYLLTRLTDLGWSVPAMIAASALLRGSYHLYQGVPMALGNVVMGVVFAWWYTRTKRVGPLIAAHFYLDMVAFVGPEVLPASWLDSLRITA